MAVVPKGPMGGSGAPVTPKKKKKKKTPIPVDKGPVPPTGSGTTPQSSTTTTTSTTGLPASAAGQLAQDAGQLEYEQEAANAYESQQPMVTSPTTTAPANAYQDQAQNASNNALATFFSTGSGDVPQYQPGQTYAYEVAAGTGSENNPT